jgi:type VI secretion system secreted protein VgrG
MENLKKMAALSNRLLANKRFEFASAAFDADKFSVVNMEGFESISRAFRFTLTLVSDDASIDFDKMLGNPASFTIFSPNGGAAVPYHGVLAGFDQLHRADGYVFYRAVLVPRLWRLSLYRISEVYLNEQAIPAIIEGVLKGARLPTYAFELKLMGSYRPRSFVCQYQETHLDFLSRWMEKEGMYYWFDHSGRDDKLIIADNRMMHAADAVQVNYRPADELDTGTAPDAVQGFVCRQKPLPYQVILQDFNHRKAAVELKASEVVSENGLGDVMIYGENFRNDQEGARYAKLRAQEIACGGKVFSGDSTAVGLRSGFFMELAHHYREDFNGKYLVTEIRHEGSQAGALLDGISSPYKQQGAGGETNYRNSFVAIPAEVQFRPERLTAKPRVAGTMNATIDGEGSGEYAELDEYGQYKVQLPFDQSDKNANKGSARVRMATPYSGSNHGMHFPLHKNAEVLLSFVDGDPDQPIIMGAVPNSENVSLVNANNPTENRISTKGGNQMHMSDVKGKEVIWLNSPFHHSSIGIGSVDPKGGGSIYAATKGSSDSVSFGNSNSMSFGSKNSLSVGTSSSLDLSIANKVSIGASIAVGLSNDIKWNMNLVPFAKDNTPKSFTIDDSSSAKFVSESTSETALESWSVSAGHAALDPLVALAKTAKTSLRTAIGVYTTLNLAASTVFSMGVNGQLKNVDDATDTDTRRAASKAERDKRKAAEIDALNKKYENGSPTDSAGAAVVKKYDGKLSTEVSAAKKTELEAVDTDATYKNDVLPSDATLRNAEIDAADQLYPGDESAEAKAKRQQKKDEINARYKAKQDAAKQKKITEINAKYDAKLKPLDKELKADEMAAAKKSELDAINKKYTAEENVDKSGMKDTSFVGGWPGIITKFGVDAIANTAAMLAIQGAARTVTTSLKAAAKSLVSKLSMDKDGIKMTVDLPVGGVPGTGGSNEMTMDSEGVTVTAKNITKQYGTLHLSGADGASIYTGITKRIYVTGKVASMVFMEQKVALSSTAVNIQAGPTTKINATTSDVTLQASTSSVKLTSADATMAAGPTVSVKVSATGIDLNSSGGKAAVGPTGVTLNGAMIQLG